MRVHRFDASLGFGHSVVIALLALLLVFCGCGGEESGSSSEWTVEEGAAEFTETLRVGDDEDYFFGEIGGIAAAEDGRIFVSDEQASHVKLLSPEGTLRDSIGREGQGPGEFNRPTQIHWGANDSLFVVDGYRSEVSVFGPDLAFEYRRSVRILRPEQKVLLIPREVMPRPGAAGYVVRFGAVAGPGQEAPSGSAVQLLGAGASSGDTLFTVGELQAYEEVTNGGRRVYPIPFARGPVVAMGPNGQIHAAWTDSLGVRVYGTDGTLRRTVDVPFDRVPITEADIERSLSDYSAEAQSAIEERIPATKPAFAQFFVDEDGRYWFGRPTMTPDSTDWWVAWPEEKRVATGTLPSNVQLEVVRDGRAYGRSTTEEGAPVVVRYEVIVQR